MIWLACLLMLQAAPDQVRFEQAQQLAAQGRCHEAEPLLKELFDAHPHSAPIEFVLGQCQFQEKDYLTASNTFRKVLELAPGRAEAQSLYGAALGLSGRTADAIEELRQATESNSTFEPSFRLLGMFGVESGHAGPDARAALEKAISLDATDERAHYWLGQLDLLNKDYDKAGEEFSAALKLQPDSGQAMLGHAKALVGSGQIEAALDEYRGVLKTQPASPEALLGIATCLYDLQQFREALTAALDASKRVSDSQDRRAVLWLLSRLYRALGDSAKAQQNEQLLAGMEQEKNGDLLRFRALQEDAMRYRAAGDYAKVASTLEAAMRIEQRQDSLVMLGDAYQALHRPRDAEKCYVKALAAGTEQQEILKRLQEVRSGPDYDKK
ncbi:MAG: tetratricopeptide repeat protein [Bryobacteraceae bacterium]